jgi:5-methylcytosine-specific restriction endonuclease McrA
MIIYGAWRYQELQPYIGTEKPRRKLLANTGEEFSVNMDSDRLECFRRSNVCVTCGIVGVIFLLNAADRKGVKENPHLNLFGIDGDEFILMTKDHIIPSSKGGRDDITNLQTMCFRCNTAKGNKIEY